MYWCWLCVSFIWMWLLFVGMNEWVFLMRLVMIWLRCKLWFGMWNLFLVFFVLWLICRLIVIGFFVLWILCEMVMRLFKSFLRLILCWLMCVSLVFRCEVLEMLLMRWLRWWMLCWIIFMSCCFDVLVLVSGRVLMVFLSEVSGFFSLWLILVVNCLIVLMWL